MSSYCIFGCSRKERSKTVHRFPSPKYPLVYRAWLELIPSKFEKENFDYRKYRVCDRHFEPEAKAKYGAGSRLKRTAVPKLHLPVDTHLPRSESLRIDLPTLSSQVIENDAGCVVENPIEVEFVSSTWGRLIHDESIPYVGEIDCASGCIGEIVPQFHLSRPEDIVQPFYGTKELEDNNNCELLHLWSKLPQKYKDLAAEVKSLRRTVRNFRKGRPSYQTRLSEANRIVDKIDELTKPVKVFCKMQFSQCNKKLKGRRFTFDEKLLSLALYKKSPKTYKSLLYKMFTLPSAKSLKRLLSQVKLSPGTDSHVIFKNLKRQASLLASEDRLCTLIFDEMSITPQLHFNPFKDELKGLDTKDCKLANHVLVFMIKTIKNHFKQPVAYYFTNSLSRFELKKYITDVITRIHETGYTIVCTVCDQSATNVATINSLVEDTRANLLRNNIEMKRDHFSIDSKKIIPLYDTPHLIKGLRNNLITKDLKFYDFVENKEKIIKWNFFEQLYLADAKVIHQGDVLRLADTITEQHIFPSKMNKMKVKLATQLFSRRVATCAIHLVENKRVPSEFINITTFCLKIDNIFDSLNVSSFAGKSGKPLTAAVKRNSAHHAFWKESIKFFKSCKFIKPNGEEYVPPSLKNFIKTIEGVQYLWRILSRKYSFDSLLTRNINQDPLENFFGSIRSYGARNVAPNCIAFEGAYKALLLSNYTRTVPQSRNTNCEQDPDTLLLPDFRVFFNENYTDNTQDTSNVTKGSDDNILLIDSSIVDTFDKPLSEDDGPLNYVCGWVVRKCLCKIVKQCKDCREVITCNKDSDKNNFLKIKEYCQDKEWLCYPSPAIVECFRQIQNLCLSYLKSGITPSGLRFKIKSYINIFVEFPFKCETHKDVLVNFFIDSSVNFFIHTWCKNINRILVGRITKIDETDPLQVMAKEYYDKRKNFNQLYQK